MKGAGGTIMTIMEMPGQARLFGECPIVRFTEPFACDHRAFKGRTRFWAKTRRESRLLPLRDGQRRIERNTPLQSLVGGSLASRFHAWRGVSGRRYVCSVFAIDPIDPEAGLPDYTDVVALAVARDESGARRCLSVFMRGATADLVAQKHFVAAALAAGAVEWHIHLLAAGKQERRLIADDILPGHMPDVSNVR